ncbi:DUF3124 domain-containing protein [Ekhidna sp. To15]|uniref:DUF3124 domain-containing protein n=1 Tax=Ekhidna sp. To15 TaxID=3395267 RepID=UPI003F526624
MNIRMKLRKYLFSLIIAVIMISCTTSDPNTDASGTDELASLEVADPIQKSETEFTDVIYVPIYSDIYIDSNNQNSLLAATLSIRNTSYTDSLFISAIDYFNTDGSLVRSYVENQISLRPMATINYVIEREDDTGGSGANFIVKLSAKAKDVEPIVQAVMIGQNGNKGFAFTTDGYSIK